MCLNPLCVPYCTALLLKLSSQIQQDRWMAVCCYLNVTDLAPKKNHVLHTTVWCLPYLCTAVRPSVQGTRVRETDLICVL